MASRTPSVKVAETAAAMAGAAIVALTFAAKPKVSSGSMPRQKGVQTMPADRAQSATVANAPAKAVAGDEASGHHVLNWGTMHLQRQNPMQ